MSLIQKLKIFWKAIVLFLAAVLSFFVFFKKQKPEDLKERPAPLNLDLPKRPKETDFKASTKKALDKVENDRKNMSSKKNYLKAMNKKYGK